MSALLERLLEWLAALGSPVILLSATLPKERRNKLIEAYQKGLPKEAETCTLVGVRDESPKKAETRTLVNVYNEEDDKLPKKAETRTLVSVYNEEEDKYPRISYATDEKIKVKHIESSAKTQTLHIEKVDENFVEKLKKNSKGNGCVAIICNTVRRSQEIYEQLSNSEFFQGNDEVDGLPN